MKYKFTLLIILAGTFFFITACKPKTEVRITVEPDYTSATPGDTVNYKIILVPNAIKGGTLGDFLIKDQNNNILFSKKLSGNASDSVFYDYIIDNKTEIGQEIILHFTAYDGDKTTDFNTTSTISILSGVPEITIKKDIQLNFDEKNIDKNMMIAINGNKITETNGNAQNADIAFIWHNTYGYALVSPDAQWISDIFNTQGIEYNNTQKHKTKIQLSDSSWKYFNDKNINNWNIKSQNLKEKNGIGVQNLIPNNVIVFETQNGIKGAIQLKNTLKSEKYLLLDIKFQVNN